MSEWKSIESAPRDGTHVLIWDGSSCDVAWVGWTDREGDVWFNGDVVIRPTHFRPRPPPPTVEDER